jgi:catechol 2,3-dioxygenase-like lactoylglutathione lyase family enzyme
MLHHIALPVSNLSASDRFYRDILGMITFDRPDFDFPGIWLGFKGDERACLHLIEQSSLEFNSDFHGSRKLHIAFGYNDFHAQVLFMEESDVKPFKKPSQRPDGVWQAFYYDPDGYVIEVTSAQPGCY